MLGGEDARELSTEAALARQPGEERPEAAAQQSLSDRRLREVEQHAAVEEQRAADVHLELAAQVPGHQLGRDRRAHVVGDEEDRRRAAPAYELLCRVCLPGERVRV